MCINVGTCSWSHTQLFFLSHATVHHKQPIWESPIDSYSQIRPCISLCLTILRHRHISPNWLRAQSKLRDGSLKTNSTNNSWSSCLTSQLWSKIVHLPSLVLSMCQCWSCCANFSQFHRPNWCVISPTGPSTGRVQAGSCQTMWTHTCVPTWSMPSLSSTTPMNWSPTSGMMRPCIDRSMVWRTGMYKDYREIVLSHA